MALSRTLIRTYAVEHDTQPELALSAANSRILADTRADLFVTVFYGVLDPTSGELTYSNAGHNPPYLYSARDGNVIQELDRTGVPLGILDGGTWQQKVVHLTPGDVLLLYTDGITEAQDAQEAFFDEERLREIVRGSLGSSAQDIQDSVIAQLGDFVGDAPQSDDITLMVVVRRLRMRRLAQEGKLGPGSRWLAPRGLYFPFVPFRQLASPIKPPLHRY